MAEFTAAPGRLENLENIQPDLTTNNNLSQEALNNELPSAPQEIIHSPPNSENVKHLPVDLPTQTFDLSKMAEVLGAISEQKIDENIGGNKSEESLENTGKTGIANFFEKLKNFFKNFFKKPLIPQSVPPEVSK